jgi:N4-bis(aminopropyl)spermidine synthase
VDQRLQQAIDELRAELGLDFAAARRVLRLLAGGTPLTVSSIVAATGASRRTVTELLDRLSEWIDRVGDSYVLRPGAAAAVWTMGGAAAAEPGFDRPDLGISRLAALVELMTVAAAGLPPTRWELDHVPATPETAVRRAHALSANFDLAGRHVVCLGDHDLTSVALALLVPEVEVTVVDVDERVLAHVAATAEKHQLRIRRAAADLRAELPPSLARSANLVFTDPPYTPGGVELFLARGLAALRRQAGNRIVFCYSPNDRQPARALAVQEVLGRLRLAVEAVVPGFNVFAGAESLGGRSALWVCQPTRTTWPAAERHRAHAHIYTRGRNAEETASTAKPSLPSPLPSFSIEEILRHHVGGQGGDAASIAVDTLLRTEPPAGQGGAVRPGSVPLADLTGVHASYVQRILLRGPAFGRAVFVTNARELRGTGLFDPRDPVRRLLSARFSLGFPRGPAWRPADLAVVVADAVPASAVPEDLAVARYVLGHPKARLAGAWREALVAAARRAGRSLTKNEARQAVRAAVDPEAIAGRYLCELPDEVLRSVAVAVTSSE